MPTVGKKKEKVASKLEMLCFYSICRQDNKRGWMRKFMESRGGGTSKNWVWSIQLQGLTSLHFSTFPSGHSLHRGKKSNIPKNLG